MALCIKQLSKTGNINHTDETAYSSYVYTAIYLVDFHSNKLTNGLQECGHLLWEQCTRDRKE